MRTFAAVTPLQQLQEVTPSFKTQLLKWQFLDGFATSSLLYGFFAYSTLQLAKTNKTRVSEVLDGGIT